MYPCLQDRDTIRKQNATVQDPHTSHFKLTQQALVQSGGRILNPLEITQVGGCCCCSCAVLACSSAQLSQVCICSWRDQYPNTERKSVEAVRLLHWLAA